MYVAPVIQVFFPLDQQWQVNRTVYSEGMARQMVWLSGLLPYQQCAEVFQRIGEQHVPASSIWRQHQSYTTQMQAHLEHQQAHVNVERVSLPDACHDHEQQKGVSMDGGMVNIRHEGWKEVKVGTVFDVEQRLQWDAQTDELVELPHAVNMSYVAVLGRVEPFAQALWACAVAHDIPTAKECSVTADGAAWIWNIAEDCFPESMQIVDWYHATQHLAQAALALYPDHEKQRHRWYKQRQHDLFQGRIHKITAPLEQAGFPELALYFKTHQRRMQYQEFRDAGYPIGSGTVESGVKQFKARLTGAGMRWSRPAAERMLILRSAVLSHTFDALWESTRAA
jgi:hypothetical protein